MTRWIGTTLGHATESYRHIPPSGEIRPGDRVLVIGAGGPMGQMHVIRAACCAQTDISITGTDMDDARLAALQKKVEPLAHVNRVKVRMVNTAKEKLDEKFSYFAI